LKKKAKYVSEKRPKKNVGPLERERTGDLAKKGMERMRKKRSVAVREP